MVESPGLSKVRTDLGVEESIPVWIFEFARDRHQALSELFDRPGSIRFAAMRLILILILVGVSDLVTTQTATFHLDDEEEAPPDVQHPERIPQREKTSTYLDRSAILEAARPGGTATRTAARRGLPSDSRSSPSPLLSTIPGEYQIPLRC